MTDYNVPSDYLISASYEYSTRYAWHAFDGRDNIWESYTTSGGEIYIQIKFPSKQVVKAFMIKTSSSFPIKSFNLYGSNDGTHYTELQQYSGQNTDQNQFFTINDEANYQYYKFGNIIGYTNGNIQVNNIQLYDNDPRTFLYKDGKQLIEWDNTNYSLNDPGAEIGGAVFRENAIFVGAISSLRTSVTFGTNEAVDVTDYNKLKALLTFNNTQQIIEADISNISGKNYISVNSNVGSSFSYSYCAICASTTKEEVYPNRLVYVNSSMGNPYDVYVNKVWLEK